MQVYKHVLCHRTWHFAVAVVEERLVSDLHGHHVVPRLVVSHPVPVGGGLGLGLEVVQAELHVDAVLDARFYV